MEYVLIRFSIWGQCGITDEFCTVSSSTTNAPGTAAPGENGCISNCGAGMVDNGTSPVGFRRVGYFEAFDKKQPCLNMDVTDINTANYSHVHLAFANVTTDFNADVTSIRDQFDKFVTMTGVKKILSFEGWAFSTDPATFHIFREGVAPNNRDTFAANIALFIVQH
jgi:hypothetical protein